MSDNNFMTSNLFFDNSFERLKTIYLKKLNRSYNEQFLIISSKPNLVNNKKFSFWIENFNKKEFISFDNINNKHVGSFLKTKNVMLCHQHFDNFRFFEHNPTFDLFRKNSAFAFDRTFDSQIFFKSLIICKPKKGGFVVSWQGLLGIFPKSQLLKLKPHIKLAEQSLSSFSICFTHFISYLLKPKKNHNLKQSFSLKHIFLFNFKLFYHNF